MLRRAIVVAAALAVGSLSAAAGDATTEFRGSGIYRPFNLMRQIKLSTAYLINLPLPELADVAHAYRLGDVMRELPVKDVADALGSGEMRLAVPVDGSSGYLTPIRAPCQIQAGTRESSEAPECVAWLDALREERPAAMDELYVFAENELSVPASGRVVTWDSDEVVEGQCNLPFSSEAARLR